MPTPSPAARPWPGPVAGRLGAAVLLALAGCVDGVPAGPEEEPGDDGAATVRWGVVEAGDGFTCGLSRDGRAYCWGSRAGGALGDGGSQGVAARPVAVLGGRAYDSLAVGRHHACGLTAGGEAWCWGRNESGQLGTPTSGRCTVDGDPLACAPQPVRAAPSLAFAGLSAGGAQSCGVTGETRLYCWGSNEAGQLGVGGLGGSTTTPQGVGIGYVSVAAGGFHTCARDGLANVLCWGGNAYGQLGDGTRLARTAPSFVVIRAGALTAGHRNSCILSPAHCWGRGTEGQIGNGVLLDALVPIRVDSEASFTQLDAGGQHVCGVTGTGRALCWGRGSEGALGTGELPEAEGRPVPVAGDRTWARVSAGHGHSCGVTEDGTALCWGRNEAGQLGDGTREDRAAPAVVAGPREAAAAAAASRAPRQAPASRTSRTASRRSGARRNPRLLR